MDNEIVDGIRNAMSRGESLERATQSFISAGYNEGEVRAAAQSITSGASQIAYPQPGELETIRGAPIVPNNPESYQPPMKNPEEFQNNQQYSFPQNNQPVMNSQQGSPIQQGIHDQQTSIQQSNIQQPQPMTIQQGAPQNAEKKKVMLLVIILMVLIIFVGALSFLIYKLTSS
jgi:hypothetical protein